MTSLWITGCGAVAPRAAGEGEPRRVAKGPELKEGFPPGAVRWLDDASLWWARSAREALGDGSPDGTGQVVGLGWTPVGPVQQIMAAALQQGYAAMPPAVFPFTVGNAPAGQAGLLLGLRGGAVTVNAKEAAGLAAVLEACRLLSADLLPAAVAGAVDVLDPLLLLLLRRLRPAGSPPVGEGAWALALRRAEVAPDGALCRIAAWAQTGATSAPYAFPDAAVVLDALDRSLRDRCGWGAAEAEFLELPGDVPALAAGVRHWCKGAGVSTEPAGFRERFGVSGAAWAGAACAAARRLAEGKARRALLFALATGGAAYGLSLEACDV